MAVRFGRGAETRPALAEGFDSDLGLRALLMRLNPSTKILRLDAHILTCRAPRVYGLPRVPTPYGFKGGAVRIALEALFGHDIRALRPRDIDLVRFGMTEGSASTQLDQELAAAHMPEDARHGHGVEVCASLDQYLQTRDFTVSQAALVGGQLVVARSALEDCYRGILRPTPHLLAQGSVLEGKMFMKALRLCAERRARGLASTLSDLPPFCLASPFDLALHLARITEVNQAGIGHYLALALEHGALDASWCIEGDPFHPDTPAQVWEALEEILGPSLPKPSSQEPLADRPRATTEHMPFGVQRPLREVS